MFDDKITKHESFGAITVNRVSGQSYLFGSEALHHGFIRVEISDADMRRSLSDDHVYADRRLVTVDMTYEQWARFVSSFGLGMGTPCTLRQVGTKRYEEPPEPESFTSKFQDDLKETVNEAMEKLEGLITKLTESNLPGNKPLGKKEQAVVLGDIKQAVMRIKSNVPFIERQFDEAMETKVAAAIIEVEGTIAHGLREAGLASLRQNMPEYDRMFAVGKPQEQLPEIVDAEIIIENDDRGIGKP
jgi:hypothetical protein